MKELVKKNNNNFVYSYWFSLLLNIGLMVFCYSFFVCVFESNDDYYMKMVASGAYGQPDLHLTYINSIFGFVLKTLYSITRTISWYELLQCLLICLALSTITYVFINRSKNNKLLLVPFFIFLYLCTYELYALLQFTKTASILTVSGYLLLEYAIEKELKQIGIIASVFLFISGSMIRLHQFLACSFICVPLFIPTIIEFIKNHNNEEARKSINKLVITGFVSLLILAATLVVERINYSDDGWSYYLNYNFTSNVLLDEGFPSFEDNKQLYNSLGIEKEDLEMYEIWNYDDPINYDFETIETLVNARQKRNISIDSIINFVVTSIAYFFHYRKILFFTMFLCLTICLSLFRKENSLSSYIPSLITFVNLLVCMFYSWFIRIDNLFVYRVHVGFIIVATLILMRYCELLSADIKTIPIISTIIIMCMYFTFSWFSEWKIVKQDDDNSYKRNVLREIYNDDKHLYIRSESNDVFNMEKQFEIHTEYSGSNLIHLGGWMTESPLENYVKSKYQINNLYYDSIDSEVVYYVSEKDKDIKQITDYIMRNYKKDVKYDLIMQIADSKYYAYRIVSISE